MTITELLGWIRDIVIAFVLLLGVSGKWNRG